jgi:hypothetical protein
MSLFIPSVRTTDSPPARSSGRRFALKELGADHQHELFIREAGRPADLDPKTELHSHRTEQLHPDTIQEAVAPSAQILDELGLSLGERPIQLPRQRDLTTHRKQLSAHLPAKDGVRPPQTTFSDHQGPGYKVTEATVMGLKRTVQSSKACGTREEVSGTKDIAKNNLGEVQGKSPLADNT